MSKDDKKTSKLAIAGLIAAVAIPSLFFLCVLVFESLYKQLNGVLEVILLMLLILPFAALPLSIAGVVVSKKEDMKGLIPGIVGLILSAVEAILVIISIVAYLSIETKAPDHTLDSIPPHTETETTSFDQVLEVLPSGELVVIEGADHLFEGWYGQMMVEDACEKIVSRNFG